MKTIDAECNQEIEDRIDMEIVVDACDESERAMGWFYYLQDNMTFPFKAKCVKLVSISPLLLNEIVEVGGMDSEHCESDMFAEIKWKGRALCVPLKQLDGIEVDDKTRQALTDWAYWISHGYHF